MTALHDIQVKEEDLNWYPNGDDRCPNCGDRYGIHYGWDCVGGGEWPVDARYEGYENDFDIVTNEPDNSVCDLCGDHRFERTLYGRYTENHRYNSETDREDWDGIDDTEVDEYGEWKCQGCGHEVDGDVADYINERT